MSKTQSVSTDILQWPLGLAKDAKESLLAILKDQPAGEIQELAACIVGQLLPDLDEAEKDDVISNLLPFELLDCVWSESAEDGSTAFMGPNWCAFSIYRLSARNYLVVEDRIELREYEVWGSTSSFKKALSLVYRAAADRLGDDKTIYFSDGTTLEPTT